MQPPRGFPLGYVKVELRSCSPRLWGWDLYRTSSDAIVQRSEGCFRSSEDAWTAGQIALANFEAVRSSRPFGMQLA